MGRKRACGAANGGEFQLHIIKWSNDFALGIDEIDAQHMALVGMINALDASTHEAYSPEKMRRLLDELNAYVKDHFGFEERLMAGGGCSQELVTRHCGEHAYFRSVLRDLTADFENGRTSITVTLIEYLVHWLLHHIVVVDRAMAQQLNASEPELKARVAAALMQEMTDDLTESERHLLAELRRANEELENQVEERTRELRELNRRLQTDLDAARAEIQRLKAELAAAKA
jgi:hemerythrin-like metal-binding protein